MDPAPAHSHHLHTIRRKPLPNITTGEANNDRPDAVISAPTSPTAHRISASVHNSTLSIPRKPLVPTAGNRNAEPVRDLSRERLLSDRPSGIPTDSSNATPARSTRRLTKPPRAVHTRRVTPRNRLQKRTPPSLLHSQVQAHQRHHKHAAHPPTLFLLQYEKYPYKSAPGILLGAFSSLHTATRAAIQHGAFAFSKDGVKDGKEYVSKGGRMRICDVLVTGKVGSLRGRGSANRSSESKDEQQAVRASNIPAPNRTGDRPAAPKRQNTDPIPIDGRTGILIALHESPTGLCVIGAYTEKRKAWAACLKHRQGPEFEGFLDIDERGGNVEGVWSLGTRKSAGDGGALPSMACREVGVGKHTWRVGAWKIDEEVLE